MKKHSEFVESSQREFFVFKDGKNLGPLGLKKIRDAPADGEMGLEVTPIAKDSGERKIYSVRKLIPSGIPHTLMADFDFISGRGVAWV